MSAGVESQLAHESLVISRYLSTSENGVDLLTSEQNRRLHDYVDWCRDLSSHGDVPPDRKLSLWEGEARLVNGELRWLVPLFRAMSVVGFLLLVVGGVLVGAGVYSWTAGNADSASGFLVPGFISLLVAPFLVFHALPVGPSAIRYRLPGV